MADRDRVPELADPRVALERRVAAQERREVGADPRRAANGEHARVQVVALSEHPAVAEGHAADFEQHAVGEARDDVGRRVDERLDRRRVLDRVLAEHAPAHRARDAVRPEQVARPQLACGRCDADFVRACSHALQRRARKKPRTGALRALDEEGIQLGPLRHRRDHAVRVVADGPAAAREPRAGHAALYHRLEIEIDQRERLAG
jgi:hypothetical protein